MKSLTKENLSKMYRSMIKFDATAQVVKLVDTRDLKSLEGNFVPVQVRPGHHPNKKMKNWLVATYKINEVKRVENNLINPKF